MGQTSADPRRRRAEEVAEEFLDRGLLSEGVSRDVLDCLERGEQIEALRIITETRDRRW
jgi:hypothetical protein